MNTRAKEKKYVTMNYELGFVMRLTEHMIIMQYLLRPGFVRWTPSGMRYL